MVWIAVALLVLTVIIAVGMYNGLIRLEVQAQNAWADIDVQLKRRYDLIPNIVDTVKGYAAHERATFDAVLAARQRAMTADQPAAKGEAESVLGGALKNLFALAEAYPALRAVESFAALQSALVQTEESLQNARRYYNAVVRELNTRIAQFPSSLIAGTFHVAPREFFEISEIGERAVPKVGFSLPTV